MRKFKRTLAIVAVLALCAALLAGCGGDDESASPKNLTYDPSTGSFQFDAQKGAKTYIVGVSKVINDTTGAALQKINQSSVIPLADGSSVYVWSEQTGSVSGLADSDSDGIVNGNVVFREYSSSATTVGAVIKDLSKLPVGRYVLQAVAAATDELPNPEAAIYEFTIPGTLATPESFTAKINDAGHMEVTAPSSFYLNCLSTTGLPEKMTFEVYDGGSLVETIEMNDFSYTNSVNGPNKSFSFNNNTVTGSAALDASKDYTVTVTAVGDGGQVQSSSAQAYVASTTPAVSFANKLSQSASGTVGSYSLTLNIGQDASGANIYELTANINSVAILREYGTFTATVEQENESGERVTVDAAVMDEEGTTHFPEGAVLTFTTQHSDAASPVLNGVTLTSGVSVQQGPSGGGTTYFLQGSAALNGTSFDFAAGGGGSGSGGPGGPGPM